MLRLGVLRLIVLFVIAVLFVPSALALIRIDGVLRLLLVHLLTSLSSTISAVVVSVTSTFTTTTTLVIILLVVVVSLILLLIKLFLLLLEFLSFDLFLSLELSTAL